MLLIQKGMAGKENYFKTIFSLIDIENKTLYCPQTKQHIVVNKSNSYGFLLLYNIKCDSQQTSALGIIHLLYGEYIFPSTLL